RPVIAPRTFRFQAAHAIGAFRTMHLITTSNDVTAPPVATVLTCPGGTPVGDIHLLHADAWRRCHYNPAKHYKESKRRATAPEVDTGIVGGILCIQHY